MSRSEAELARRLRRTQWSATGLLALMAGIFITTRLLGDSYPGLGWLLAFSEAALIGGLADWFAVTALFRHPLGIPIPHTAIVPTRKNEIGRSLAGFIGEHFLARETVEARLAEADLADRLGRWLAERANAERLSRDLATALDWLLRSMDGSPLRESISLSLRDALERVSINDAVAMLMDVLASGNHAQALIDQLVAFGREHLETNKARIRDRIRERSPWWLPGFVDEEIYDQLVGELERILGDIGDDPRHPARLELNARLRSLKDSLASDPDLIDKGKALRDEFIAHPETRRFFQDVWLRLREYLLESFADAESRLRAGLADEVAEIGRHIVSDHELRARLDRWLGDAILYVVENYRRALTDIVSDTVAEWDAQETSRRIELHIGKDLQFIRINGTLVGGLVGVLLYGGWQLWLSF